MSYEIKKLNIIEPRRVVYAIVDGLGITERASKRLVDKGRVKCNGVQVQRKGEVVCGELSVLFYEATPTMDVKIVYEHEDFAIFDKPPFMLVHPNGFDTKTSLLDNVKALFGHSSNITHRLDYETSGLVIASKNKRSEAKIKTMFENREIQKRYLAFLQGELTKRAEVCTFIESRNVNGVIRIKQNVSDSGKESVSIFEPVEYFADRNASLVRVSPLTGRRHQIRLHAAHIGMPIFGEPIYGNTECTAKHYLDKLLTLEERVTQTRAARVCLQANELEFDYEGERILAYSKMSARDDFLLAVTI
jgi:23S rRNA pseudouridine1911/1915/1917 synthase